MKTLLMHPDRDFVKEREVSRSDQALIEDLDLEPLLAAMAGGDELVLQVCRSALLAGAENDVTTVLYRQEALRDCLDNPRLLVELYTLALEALDRKKRQYLGFWSTYPSAILRGSTEAIAMFLEMFRQLRDIAARHQTIVHSRALRSLFSTIIEEFTDPYIDEIRAHLGELQFPGGILVSASLGPHIDGRDYSLRLPQDHRPTWLRRLVPSAPRKFTFHLHPRDDAGAQILGQLRDQGINEAANALAQSAEHIVSFFQTLATELAFYVGCTRLRDALAAIQSPVCFPSPRRRGSRELRFDTLYDPCLALRMGRAVVGNRLDAEGVNLVIVTGANQGGKTTFLRSVGVAVLMMQAGLFVPATAYEGEMTAGLFTHFKREEDRTMKSGKLDEELARMSEIADLVSSDCLVLFNESFASTNEREGSEIARQVVHALLEARIKVFFVTHLYEFAHGFLEDARRDTVFLRAERLPDGTRPFALAVAEPLDTSYGRDLYREVFGVEQ